MIGTYKEMHYLTLVKVTQNIAQYPLHHEAYAQTHFEVATSKALGGYALTRKHI